MTTGIDSAWDMIRLGDITGGRAALKEFIDSQPPENRYTAMALLAFEAMRTPCDHALLYEMRDNAWAGAAEVNALHILSWEVVPSTDARAQDWAKFKNSAQPNGPYGCYVAAMAELAAFDERVRVDFSADPSSGVSSALTVGISSLLHGNAQESLAWFEKVSAKPEQTAKRYRRVISGMRGYVRQEITDRARLCAKLGRALALRDLGKFQDAHDAFEDYGSTVGAESRLAAELAVDCFDRVHRGVPSGGVARDPGWKDTAAIGAGLREHARLDGALSGDGLLSRFFG